MSLMSSGCRLANFGTPRYSLARSVFDVVLSGGRYCNYLGESFGLKRRTFYLRDDNVSLLGNPFQEDVALRHFATRCGSEALSNFGQHFVERRVILLCNWAQRSVSRDGNIVLPVQLEEGYRGTEDEWMELNLGSDAESVSNSLAESSVYN